MPKNGKNAVVGGYPPVKARADQPWFLRRIIQGGRQDQVNIPRPILHALGLRRGDQLVVWVQGRTIHMRSVTLEQIYSAEGPL